MKREQTQKIRDTDRLNANGNIVMVMVMVMVVVMVIIIIIIKYFSTTALQKVTGKILNDSANKAPDARLDIHACGLWEKQSSAFFDVRVCHPNADSYKDLQPNQIYRQHENEKKRQYASRVLEIEHGTFTPLVFTTTGGIAAECLRYHSRLAELNADKKAESYANTISWIRAKVSFAILRSAILCLRGSR